VLIIGVTYACSAAGRMDASVAATVHLASERTPRELTPADAMTTTRLVGEPLTSPDGRRFLLRTAHGDIARDGVWVDWLTGRLDTLSSASHPTLCAHLLTSGLGTLNETQGADQDPEPSAVNWLNDHRIAFLWSDAHRVRQVATLDLAHCHFEFLTHSRSNISGFALDNDGTLLFDAKVPHTHTESARLWHEGFTVPETSDGFSILRGDIDGQTDVDVSYNNQWFIHTVSGKNLAVSIGGSLIDRTYPAFREITLSPSGRFAITHVGLAAAPDAWSHYTDARLQALLEANKTHPGRIPLSHLVIDLQTATAHLLWHAPLAFDGRLQWSPSGESVILAPTFLPEPDTAPDRPGVSAAEVNAATGRYSALPIDLTAREVTKISWESPTTVEISSTNLESQGARYERFLKIEDHWEPASSAAIRDTPDAPPNSGPNAARIHVDVRQGLNTPPRVMAVDAATGNSSLILDPNHSLAHDFKLGRVERLSGTLPNGRQWLAQLMYPADYIPGKKYPLLIQGLYGSAWGPESFELYGPWGSATASLGPSNYAAYPGQLLATRNMAVLQLEVLHPGPGTEQAEDVQLGFETLAEQLVASGLIDRSKVALAGFSRNGYYVEFTLTHSAFPFAAAIAADNYDPSYFQSALSNWRPEDAQMNGTSAFGAGLQDWVSRAPGFNVDHIHTPLLMIGQQSGLIAIIGSWEIYSRLRHLRRAVDLYVMPDADRFPSHLPQNPRQILSIQEHVIDWLSFWLTDREDPSAHKQAQYQRWHRFRELQTLARPQL
jgi:hypothetical protein